jgi:SAM-dependent methyltransferase
MEGTELRKLAELEDAHWWYAERRHLVAKALRHTSPGTALDVGAAGGGNTRVLKRLGWRPCAVEYAAEGAEIAAERGLAVVRGDATALPFASESVDLVVAFDVLEHIVDDRAAAAEILRVLRPGAPFLVAVPCDPRLWSAHDEAVDHVRRYTRATLRELLEGAGFVVESMTSWNVLLRPVVALRRRSRTGSDLVELPRVVNFALRVLITLERYLPVKRLPGVTLLATARRSATAAVAPN